MDSSKSKTANSDRSVFPDLGLGFISVKLSLRRSARVGEGTGVCLGVERVERGSVVENSEA